MNGKVLWISAVAGLLILFACGGERHVYKGSLTTTVERSGSGDYVGSDTDEVEVTMTKYGDDKASFNFKTLGGGKIKTELEPCTLQVIKVGSDWTEQGSKKCANDGQEYQILKGAGVTDAKDLRLSVEMVPYGTGKTNKYRFEGKEN
ncbi:hypothetical protein BH10ACI3_BH10ACI3_24410 [soil metagenome]